LVKVTHGCYSTHYIVKSDYRLGGVPRYILADKDEEFVMIPDEIRDCSCFVCYENEERQHIVCGTAFFIAEVLGVSGKDKNLTMTYSNVFLVTAKHLIDGIKLKYPNLPMGVRVNSTDGKTHDIVIPIDAWFYHPTDSSVDVAVLPWFSNEGLAFTTNPTYTAITHEVIRENGIGIGDEVFVIGLFTKHHGGERNLPIVRTGNIAMMPEEPVQTNYGLMTAYLIELRSIGGLSGSPVYVHKQWADPKHKRTGHILYWLGMIHGHWNIEEKSIDMPIHDKEQQLNTGIGIVVPAYKILEILDREEILAMREESKRNFTQRNIPTEDSGLQPR
jgi:hypothetical protein